MATAKPAGSRSANHLFVLTLAQLAGRGSAGFRLPSVSESV